MKNIMKKMNKGVVFASGMLLLLCLVLIMGATYVGVKKGEIVGAYVEYIDEDTITVTAGYGECNGSRFELTSDASHDMTSLITTQDFHYIYIDDSASSYPTPTIIDSTDEPSWSDSKLGYYYGNDRCIGVVRNMGFVGHAHVDCFVNNSSQKYVHTNWRVLLTGGEPDYSHQTLEATAHIPVNAIAVSVVAHNTDTDDVVDISVGADEYQDSQLHMEAYEHAKISGWIQLARGGSRDLQWRGDDDDDDAFGVSLLSYQIER